MRPAVVLSGQTTALGVVRALGQMGVPVAVLHYDPRDTAHLSRYCTWPVRVPHPEKAEAEFLAALRQSAARFSGGVLFPAADEAVAAVARHKPVLERDFAVACPDWEIARKFIDKRLTCAVAQACGVPAPRTLSPSSAEEAWQCGAGMPFPCLVKPCQGHLYYDRFRRKMVVAASREEMISAYEEAERAGLQVMLQEFIPGRDADVVNYNSYFHDGKPALEFTAVHVRNAPPLVGSPRVVLSKEVPEVIEAGRRLLAAMGFEGYACTEFKRDARDGVYKLMEVNGRHNLSTLLAVRCGMNFPWAHYRHLAYGEAPSSCRYSKGVYWIDLTRDVGYTARHLLQERYPLREYLRPYLGPHVFAILDWRDLKPFVKRCTFLCGEAARSLYGLRRERGGARTPAAGLPGPASGRPVPGSLAPAAQAVHAKQGRTS